MLDLIKIGKLIASLREMNQMTQDDLADNLFVTRQAVSKWERGISLPIIDVMVRLTELFQISIDDLLTGEKPANSDFSYLLQNYPRSYVLQQLIRGKTDVRIEEALYLLSQDERDLVISHLLKDDIQANLSELFPYLNQTERKRILLFIRDKPGVYCDKEFKKQLTGYEKQILEVKNEH